MFHLRREHTRQDYIAGLADCSSSLTGICPGEQLSDIDIDMLADDDMAQVNAFNKAAKMIADRTSPAAFPFYAVCGLKGRPSIRKRRKSCNDKLNIGYVSPKDFNAWIKRISDKDISYNPDHMGNVLAWVSKIVEGIKAKDELKTERSSTTKRKTTKRTTSKRTTTKRSTTKRTTTKKQDCPKTKTVYRCTTEKAKEKQSPAKASPTKTLVVKKTPARKTVTTMKPAARPTTAASSTKKSSDFERIAKLLEQA